MRKRVISIVLAVIAALQLSILWGCDRKESRLAEPAIARPNLIILLADDLGYNDLGPY